VVVVVVIAVVLTVFLQLLVLLVTSTNPQENRNACIAYLYGRPVSGSKTPNCEVTSSCQDVTGFT
jgi:hypothetical protein